MRTCSRSPRRRRRGPGGPVPDFGGGPADASGPDRARRLGRQPVDPVGQRPQRPRRLPPRLDARPRRIGGRSRCPRGAWLGRAVLSPTSSPPRSPTGTGSRTNGSTEWGTGTASSSMRRRIRSCSPARSGGRAPATCTAARARRQLFEHLITEEARDPDDLDGGPVHRPDGAGDRAGPLGGERGPDALDAGSGRGGPRGRRGPSSRRRAAAYCRELADDWNASIEDWTYATDTRLAREFGVDGHYVRIASSAVLGGRSDLDGGADPEPAAGRVQRARRRDGRDRLPGARPLRPAQRGRPADPLDAGRRGRPAAGRKRPGGPVWHRYNGDGYGEHPDGSPYDGTGVGRGWPLWSASAATTSSRPGRDPRPYLEAMRRLRVVGRDAPGAGLGLSRHPGARPVPRPSERIRDAARLGSRGVREARAFDGARPRHRPTRGGLAALRGPSADPRPARRGGSRRRARRWSPAASLRFEVLAPCRVHYSLDGWRTTLDLEARDTGARRVGRRHPGLRRHSSRARRSMRPSTGLTPAIGRAGTFASASSERRRRWAAAGQSGQARSPRCSVSRRFSR